MSSQDQLPRAKNKCKAVHMDTRACVTAKQAGNNSLCRAQGLEQIMAKHASEATEVARQEDMMPTLVHIKGKLQRLF